MKMQEIKSSVFKAMGYDEERQALHIQFNSGAIFEYGQVLPEHWEGLNAADSAEAYFSRYIRPNHDAKPIAPAERNKEGRPKCKVNGVLAPNAMCGRVSVKGSFCSAEGECEHKEGQE